jgi:ankyrin repeat protein
MKNWLTLQLLSFVFATLFIAPTASARGLCREFFNTNFSEISWNSRLQEAIENHETDVALKLLEMLEDVGGSVNSRDHFGKTVLQAALFHKNLPVVQALLKRPDLEVNPQDLHFAYHNGKKAYEWVVPHTELELLRAMLDSGLYDLNVVDFYGNTILHYAIMQTPKDGKPSHEFTLIWKYKDKIRLNIVSKNGKTTPELAREIGNPNVLNAMFPEN